MRHLLLTLGHNSSAILVEDGEVIIGYETERLSKKKSDSTFPALAIEEIQKYHDIPKNVSIYVSHWFTDTKDIDKINKWWNPVYIKSSFPESKVITLSPDFTHHDAHCYSALAFAGNDMPSDSMVIVADGFGNYGETMSIYQLNHHEPVIRFRSFGFDTSIGLMYQYATAYLDLKMNQDEYKLLGYEANIDDLDINLERLNMHIRDSAAGMFHKISTRVANTFDPVTNISALPEIQNEYYRTFDKLCDRYDVKDLSHKRIFIAYYVQNVTELVMSTVLRVYSPKDVILVGGIFMNVKLNNMIAKQIKGKTCIMPLAGDQGAAIGVYQYQEENFIWPDHLFWGRRNLSNLMTHGNMSFYVLNYKGAVELAREFLQQDLIVNLVGPYMEFGARALGMTSTVALPTKENVEYINMCNERSTVMPMAGFAKEETVHAIHPDYGRIVKSMEYMICTRDYDPVLVQDAMGVVHYNHNTKRFTGRTQLVEKGNILYDVLTDNMPILINTSFNPHGKPIVYDEKDIMSAHKFMWKRDVNERVVTIVYKDNV